MVFLAPRLPAGKMLPSTLCQKVPVRRGLLAPYFVKPLHADIHFVVEWIFVGHLCQGGAVRRIFN